MSEGAPTCSACSSDRAIGSTSPIAWRPGPCFAEQRLSPTDLERALAELERSEGTAVRTIVGVNEDGVFGTSRAGWHPDLPDAGHGPLIPLLWIRILELLGRVPQGSAARFVKDGALPGEPEGGATACRMAS